MARIAATTIGIATLLASAPASWAQPSLTLSQSAHDVGNANGCENNQSVKVYLTAGDRGTPATEVAKHSLSALLDNRPLTTASVTPFASAGEGVLYIVLVDVSGSLPGPPFEAMRAGLIEFVSNLEPSDRMSLRTFGSEVRTVLPPTADKEALITALGNLQPVEKETKLYSALQEALPLRQVGGELPERRAILVVTDGKDEGSGWSADNLRDQIRQAQMPIYAVGWGPGQGDTQPLSNLRNFATISGGLYERAAATNVGHGYTRLQAAVRSVHVARFRCDQYDNCPTDGRPHQLTLTYTSGNLSTSASLPVLMPLVAKVPCPQAGPNWWLIGGGIGAGALLAGIIGLVLMRRRPAKSEAPTRTPPDPIDLTRPRDVPRETGAAKPPKAPPVPFRVTCAVVHGAQPGHQFSVTVASGAPAVVGRGANCAIRLDRDPGIEDRHFELQHGGSYLLLVNLAQGGGTRHNGVAIHGPVRVEDGDIVSAGLTDLRVRLEC